MARVPFPILLGEASELTASLGGKLEELVRNGHHPVAVDLLADLARKVHDSAEETVNTSRQSDDAQKQTYGSGPASPPPSVGIRDTGLTSRDIDDRFKRQRHLRASLISDTMMIFMGQNAETGVTSDDTTKELSRLGLGEPIGTVRSRASRLKSEGLLDRDAPYGTYRLSREGHTLALKAIKKYGFQISLPDWIDHSQR